MRRSYIIEYTILLIICFFAVRTCISEKQANTDLKSENTAISDSTHLYKEKYGQEHAEKQALLDTMQLAADSLSDVLSTFCNQVHELPAAIHTAIFIQADTFRTGNKEIIRFRYGNNQVTATGLLVLAYTQYSPVASGLPVAGNMLLALPAGCKSCHKNAAAGCLYDYSR